MSDPAPPEAPSHQPPSLDDPAALPSAAPAPPPAGLRGVLTLARWPRLQVAIFVVVLIYLLITSVSMISTGFKWAAGDQAESLFGFATNPFAGLLLGVLATAIVQSSSATTSVVVGLVGGRVMSVNTAIPIIMGANIGTTVTALLVSMGHITRRQEFRRAFAAGSVHDLFNWTAVVIFLSLELFTRWLNHGVGFLELVSGWGANLVVGDAKKVLSGNVHDFNVMKAITKPVIGLLANGKGGGVLAHLGRLPGAVTLIVISLGLIFFSIIALGRILRQHLTERAERLFHLAVGRGPVSGIACGTVITALVQSSSTTTSLVVPMAGSGVLTLRQVFPFTIGANIGTTVTALLASLAPMETNEAARVAFQIALVHTLFNSCAAVVIYGIPWLRAIPLKGAEFLANLTLRSRLVAVFYVLIMFFIIPLGCLGITRLVAGDQACPATAPAEAGEGLDPGGGAGTVADPDPDPATTTDPDRGE